MTKKKNKSVDLIPSVVGDNAPIEEQIPHANQMSLKQQLASIAEQPGDVLGYLVMSVNEGKHAVASTYPTELNDLLILWGAGALSKYNGMTIGVILQEASARLKALNKSLEEESKKEVPKILTP